MSSKLRTLYDKLYVGGETYLLARQARRDAKQNAKTVVPSPRVAQEYKTTIRSYWRQFKVSVPAQYWFTLFANEHKPFSPKYIPDDLWFHGIIPHFNNLIFAKAFQDKCLANVLFPDMKRPATVIKRIAGVFYDDDLNLLSKAQAVARCQNVGRILVKPSIGSGQGHGIRFYDSGDLTENQIEDIFSQYGNNFIIQEKMAQHADLARLNPNSLNTVRINTFLYHNEIHILSSILRVSGGAKEVDNTSQGGYQCSIHADGTLYDKGFTHIDGHWDYVDSYPNGIRFQDVTVPSYQKAVALVSEHAKKMSHFKIIGWDIAIDPAGEPVLIEFNVIPGQDQESGGPTLGELTDEVLAEVFGRRRKK
jgi:hypothetical protein